MVQRLGDFVRLALLVFIVFLLFLLAPNTLRWLETGKGVCLLGGLEMTGVVRSRAESGRLKDRFSPSQFDPERTIEALADTVQVVQGPAILAGAVSF